MTTRTTNDKTDDIKKESVPKTKRYTKRQRVDSVVESNKRASLATHQSVCIMSTYGHSFVQRNGDLLTCLSIAVAVHLLEDGPDHLQGEAGFKGGVLQQFLAKLVPRFLKVVIPDVTGFPSEPEKNTGATAAAVSDPTHHRPCSLFRVKHRIALKLEGTEPARHSGLRRSADKQRT